MRGACAATLALAGLLLQALRDGRVRVASIGPPTPYEMGAIAAIGAYAGFMGRVEQARGMAVAAHGGQRYGAHPYSVHLDAVAAICEPFGGEAQVVAYLHDTLEDTGLAKGEIEAAFGGVVAACVEALTDPAGADRKSRKAGTYARLGAIRAEMPEALALVVKAADRLANVRASVADGNARLLAIYRDEHEDFVRAVHRAGLNDALVEEATRLLRTA